MEIKLRQRQSILILIVFCVIILFGYLFNPLKYNNEENKTSIEVNKNGINLGKSDIHSFAQAAFWIKNTGKKPLVIKTVTTSCGCTVAKYDKKPIVQGEATTVILEYKPNSLGYFSKTADVVCNVSEGYVRLKISGEVVEK